MSNMPLEHIAICGAGLAGALCAAALTHNLPDNIKITLLDTPGAEDADIFYGDVTSPPIYDFLLSLNLPEPILLPNTNTTFSLGTKYTNWGQSQKSWIQSFHLPLPNFQGVEFHHYLSRLRNTAPSEAALEDYLMSAHAAAKGVFAHPPSDKSNPLSTVEYGYHFSAKEWRNFILRQLGSDRVTKVSGEISSFERSNGKINFIRLVNNEKLKADLYIDCLGLNSKPFSRHEHTGRKLRGLSSFEPELDDASACRKLEGASYGWSSTTALQGGRHRLTVYDPASEHIALAAHGQTDDTPVEVTLGYQNKPWLENCLALGHSAAVLEPLTPAPMILLQRDIERLLELIPISQNMTVEAREYNRRFRRDYEHGSMFQRSFFEPWTQDAPPYWEAAGAEPMSEKLMHKISQFHRRGTIVQYDLEPFEKEDWVQQHYGMGRLPSLYDPLADRVDQNQIRQTLNQMRLANDALARKMPPQQIYLRKLLDYFRKKHA